MNDFSVGDDEATENLDTRARLARHWKALDAGNLDAAHTIYHEDAVLDYPQSGERIAGRDKIKASRAAEPPRTGIKVRSVLGQEDLWVTEYSASHGDEPAFVVSIMEFRDGAVVRETQYITAPFAAPAWRAKWLSTGGSSESSSKSKT
jgi:hypothetical protein